MFPSSDRPDASADTLLIVVGLVAIAAPALHSLTDVVEWYQGGFSRTQLWLNYAAFVPMTWLLLGIYAVHTPTPPIAGLLGALLYGESFTYFAYTTLHALADGITRYDDLWQRLGLVYTMHGAVMVCGGVLFGVSVLNARWLGRQWVLLFVAGLMVNLVLGLLPVPESLQIAGSSIRNAGLVGMGFEILRKRARARG